MTKALLIQLLFVHEKEGIEFDGDQGALGRLLTYVDSTSNTFPIVTP